MRRAALLITLVVTGLVPGAASAAGAKPDAARLAKAGLRVGWPVSRSPATLEPGSKVSVVVRRVAGRPHPASARVSLVRLSGSGARLRTIAARTLRSGTFTAILPDVDGVTYALELAAGAVRHRSLIRTPALPRTPETDVPPLCAAPSATLTLDRTVAAPGDEVKAVWQNTGCTAISQGPGIDLERAVDDGWVPVALDVTWTQVVVEDPPGVTREYAVTVPLTAPAGRYRLIKRGTGKGIAVLSGGEFDVRL